MRSTVRDHDVEDLGREVQQLEIVHLRTNIQVGFHQNLAPPDHGNHVAPAEHQRGLGVEDPAVPADALDGGAGISELFLQLGHRPARPPIIPDVEGTYVDPAAGGDDPGLGVCAAQRRLERLTLRSEIDTQQLGPQSPQQPRRPGRAEDVRHGVGHRDAIDQRRLFLGRDV